MRQPIYGKSIHAHSVCSVLTIQKFHQSGNGTTSVADAILVLRGHLGKSAAVPFHGLEDAVITETSRAVALGEDNTLDLALEHVHLIALQQSNGGAETCRALGHSLQLVEHLVDVGLAVVTRPGITRRVHARFAT